MLGKTAADDFAYRGNGTSSHTGQVLNPYDESGTRTPGSAVAVAGRGSGWSRRPGSPRWDAPTMPAPRYVAATRRTRLKDLRGAFYDVLPPTYEQCEPLLKKPGAEDPAGQSFARSRAAVLAELAASMRSQGVAAMVYPTMPFNAPRAEDDWPDIRTPLKYGNWLGLPEVSVPAGYGKDGLPALNLSIIGLPGDDALVLRWAHAFERQAPRFKAPPKAAGTG